MTELLGFMLADEEYAVDLLEVREIVRLQPITAVPRSADWVRGVVTLRGVIVPIFELRRRLGLVPVEPGPAARIVVAHRGEELAGLLVDSITQVVRVPAERLEPPPQTIRSGEAEYLRGVVRLEDRLVILARCSASPGGDVHVKGTYQGQLTVVALKGGNSLKGNVWVDGNVLASDNPRTNPSSTDILGLVAERMGYITKDPSRTNASVLNIQAAIYCHNGEFTAEDFWLIPKSGTVNLYGSLCQQTAGSLGVFSSTGCLLNGMFYHITLDARMTMGGPPQFPFSGNLRLVAWWEN